MSQELPQFADLPAALVAEVLDQTSAIGDRLLGTFQDVKRDRERLRRELVDDSLILSESSLGYPPLPTTCAADGSYAIERLLSADLAAAAAVCVEGLTPPSETRHWEQPRHRTFIVSEVHHPDTATILRAVMLGRELELAVTAPHELVMLDGSFTLPVIYFNQALGKAADTPELLSSREFLANWKSFLNSYLQAIRGERSDKNVVALPKYSTRREIGAAMRWPAGHDDRGMLTFLLQPGELTRPRALEQPDQDWHLYLPTSIREEGEEVAASIVDSLKAVHIFYYKPHHWIPALRVEVSEAIANNPHRLAVVVQGLKHQCATAAMLEPYPIYLADRTVKALARAVPAFRQVTTQRIAEKYDGEIGDVYFAMHGYRSESGRGS